MVGPAVEGTWPDDGASAHRSLETLIDRARAAFVDRFGHRPAVVSAAPGRVNLIGDHTDYNGGPALPMAIDRWTVVAAGPGRRDRTRLVSVPLGRAVEVAPGLARDLEQGWARFAAGAVEFGGPEAARPPAADVLIDSSVPIGAGLSSSAALAIALILTADRLSGNGLERPAVAALARRAEHCFAGVPCGDMDQRAILEGRAGHAVLVEAGGRPCVTVPLPSEAIAVLVIDTGSRRRLDDGTYAARLAECRTAADRLDVASLAEVGEDRVDGLFGLLPEVLARRARHVACESARVFRFAAAVASNEWTLAGRTMDESHDSLRDDYEVTGPELDAVVAAARSIGPDGGVLGARMTGAGMGGCCVALVERSRLDEAVAGITGAMAARGDQPPRAFEVRATDGARVVEGC